MAVFELFLIFCIALIITETGSRIMAALSYPVRRPGMLPRVFAGIVIGALAGGLMGLAYFGGAVPGSVISAGLGAAAGLLASLSRQSRLL